MAELAVVLDEQEELETERMAAFLKALAKIMARSAV